MCEVLFNLRCCLVAGILKIHGGESREKTSGNDVDRGIMDAER